MSEQLEKNVPVEILKQIIEKSPLGISLWKVEDPSDAGTYRLVFANSAASEAAGVSWEQFKDKTLREGFPKMMDTYAPKFWTEAIRTGHVQYLPDIEYSDDNVVKGIYSTVVVPIGKDYICLMIRNVTAERMAQRELKDKLVEIDKLRRENEDD